MFDYDFTIHSSSNLKAEYVLSRLLVLPITKKMVCAFRRVQYIFGALIVRVLHKNLKGRTKSVKVMFHVLFFAFSFI